MRIKTVIVWLLTLPFLAMLGGPASAAPLPSHRVATSSALILTNGQRVHYRAHRHRAKHGYRHRKCRKGWLPPLPRYRHAPGKWSHKHCHHSWHRCHYYFYGYKQWARWNPDKSRAYFYRRYHH